MQVILRMDVPHLGEVGDIVTVKPGYARNYLLPRGKAVVAEQRQIRRFEHEKRIIEAQVAKERVGAEQEASRLNGVVLRFERAASEQGKLFGSVTSMDIEAMLSQHGHAIGRRQIKLGDNIKALGEFDIDIRLHRDVTASIKVDVQAKVEAPTPVESADA